MKIHFRLKSIDEIREDLSFLKSYQVGFYNLTDGDLWLEINGHKIYIYSQEAINHYQLNDKYVDYQLDTFVLYFSFLFESISKNLSVALYDLFTNVQDTIKFGKTMDEWFELYEEKSEEVYNAFLIDYKKISNLCHDRCMMEYPPTAAPKLYFFRYKNEIKIIWNTDIKTENEISLWEAESNIHKMEYAIFVKEIKNFYYQFIEEMQVRIKEALSADWGNLTIDEKLEKQFLEIKENTLNKLASLDNDIDENNEKIEKIYERVQKELTNI